MKRIALAVSLLVLAGCSALNASVYGDQVESVSLNRPSIEVKTGVLGRSGSISPIYGFGVSKQVFLGDLSLSYWRAMDVTGDNLESKDMDLHNFSLEYFYPILSWLGSENQLINGLSKIKVGGGLGWTIPNLAGGVFETADNDISYTAGALYSHPFKSVTLEAGIKGFFFRTDSHITKFDSHNETLSNGTQVEVLDEIHYNNVINCNSILATVAVRF